MRIRWQTLVNARITTLVRWLVASLDVGIPFDQIQSIALLPADGQGLPTRSCIVHLKNGDEKILHDELEVVEFANRLRHQAPVIAELLEQASAPGEEAIGPVVIYDHRFQT